MDRNWWTRVVIILAVALGSLWYLIPTYYSLFVVDRKDRNNFAVLDARMPGFAPAGKHRLSLGLDLQGGIHMVMRVDTKTALIKRNERRGVQIANWVKEKKLGEVKVSSDPDQLQLTLVATDPATMDAIEKEVLATFDDFGKVSR
ncbi:MAG: protein-export rane protein SecD, partial [Myxococcaceae bacterium]|nr:protein-export rane protein SecD [Myxococcaceae bacterium]